MLLLSLCACGSATTSTDEPITGTYTNVAFLPYSEFTLNENSTYDRANPNEKGTYKASKNGFVLTDTDDDETQFSKDGDYYYRTNLICCFEEDEDYGLAPTFTDEGRSNQWFSAYYDSISDTEWKVIILTLKEDGTFKLRDCVRNMSGSQSEGTVYEGEYSLDGNVLNLKHADGTISFLYINEKIYFDVFKKQS